MSNPIVKSVIYVTLLWYILAAIFTGGNQILVTLLDLPGSLLFGLFYVAIGIPVGVLIMWYSTLVSENHIKRSLLPSSLRGIEFNIGPVIGLHQQPERTDDNEKELIPSDIIQWYRNYKEKFPVHAELFLAVAQILRGNKHVPASPIPGGHGGASLELHSYNVLRESLKHRENFVYEGHRNKKGKIVFPRTNSLYQFDKPEDPLVPICALAHDIGKIECYRVTGNHVTEIKANHDEEGGKLISSIPELWALTPEELNSVIICISFYHHISGIPIRIGDRARALAEFTIMIDIIAGKKEGEGDMESQFGFMEEENLPPNPSEAAEQQALIEKYDAALAEHASKPAGYRGGQKRPSIHDNPDVEVVGTDPFGAKPKVEQPAVEHHRAVQPVAATDPGTVNNIRAFGDDNVPTDAEMALSFEAFSSVVMAPGSFGKDASERIGFKSGEWLYIQDRSLRNKVGRSFNRPDVQAETNGNIHAFTKAVLFKLYQLDALYYKHNGLTYSPRVALFNCEASIKGGKLIQLPCCLVVKASMFPAIAGLPDAQYPPRPVSPFKGEASAYAKKETVATANVLESTSVSEPSADNDATVEELPAAASSSSKTVVQADGLDALNSTSDEPFAGEPQAAESVVQKTGVVADLKKLVHDGELADHGGQEESIGDKQYAVFPAIFVEQRYKVIFGDDIENGRWRERETDEGLTKVFIIRINQTLESK